MSLHTLEATLGLSSRRNSTISWICSGLIPWWVHLLHTPQVPSGGKYFKAGSSSLNLIQQRFFSPKLPEIEKHKNTALLQTSPLQRKWSQPNPTSQVNPNNETSNFLQLYQFSKLSWENKGLCFPLPPKCNATVIRREKFPGPSTWVVFAPVLWWDGCLNKQRLRGGLYLEAGTGYRTASSHPLPLIVGCIRRLSKHNLQLITFEC